MIAYENVSPGWMLGCRSHGAFPPPSVRSAVIKIELPIVKDVSIIVAGTVSQSQANEEEK